ncbi:MAG: type II toxin-antitoxin system HicB family antitoxin [Acetomicrobium sp.]|jgi:predicted RNase H-like HicB family nuclease|uniref:type II toxin-antitoxin system HicB family antitoxin n=1 Tax=Acetomicrobium TaxID=49894 RepID=UPI0026F07752|nr:MULTISPECIES: type II toxin-antitoxin system HicB family antitoxin [Acetomicrobium]MDR9770477.1 type II toxin-antitoxin system HicB family antitoxin [Acetomicrobium sp.]HOM98128.1 type II toxin-antitoxin system HicB family antitoxin [Acetomicrobium sp.]HQA37252.1 type II toxin-antitoxin system HicB family antitoxin [Acetomicrobium sp.]
MQVLTEYIEAALESAKYEIIEDEEPYYGAIPELEGVWATGKTLEECRRNLKETLEGWIVIRLQRGLAIPPIGQHRITEPERRLMANG